MLVARMRLPLLLLVPLAAYAAAPAELVVHNGKIVTMNPAAPAAQAMAVSGDRIAAIGGEDAIRPLIRR